MDRGSRYSPLRLFLEEALKTFEVHLEGDTVGDASVENRIRGAREFLSFILGEPAPVVEDDGRADQDQDLEEDESAPERLTEDMVRDELVP